MHCGLPFDGVFDIYMKYINIATCFSDWVMRLKLYGSLRVALLLHIKLGVTTMPYRTSPLARPLSGVEAYFCR